MPIITTPLSAGAIVYTANCYVSLVEADDWFSEILSGLWWAQQGDNLREMALVEATRRIEHLLRGQDGDKFDEVQTASHPKGQPLQFPRSWDRDADGTLIIDPDLKEVTYLLALHVLKVELGAAGVVDSENMERIGLTSAGQDGVSASRGRVHWSDWPREVRKLIEPFWQRQGDTTEGPPEKRRWTKGWVGV